MVAQITEGTAFDKHGRPFRRRNFVPGALMFAALAVAALLVWVDRALAAARRPRGRRLQPAPGADGPQCARP